MYKYAGKVIRVGKSWVDNNGITHPKTWGKWSEEEKAAAGLVWEDDPQPFDSRFFWAAGIPKNIEDVAEVDENGDPLLDEKGNQVITKGLKSSAKDLVKTQAGGLLKPTDWMVVRGVELPGKPPSLEVKNYRQAVRDASDAIEAAIDACTTHEDFMALYETPVDPEGNPLGNAPINDFPEE